MNRKLLISFSIVSCFFSSLSTASVTSNPASLLSLLNREVSKLYPNAKIEWTGEPLWIQGAAPANPKGVRVIGDDARGRIHFTVQDTSPIGAEGWIGFTAWVQARVTSQRVRPGDALRPEFFSIQSVNVSQGTARDFRGVILPAEADISGLEAVQSLLEGQPLVSSAVRRVPDVRRGDSVQIHMVSGDLTLSTLGVAAEPAYLNQSVRVVTSKTKKELLGRLSTGGVVEVRL